MRTLHLVLYIIAALAFAMAAFAPVPTVDTDPRNNRASFASRVNFIAAGLFAWVLVPLSVVIEDFAND
jgi:hypothetical protein